ncbi:MAG TPA: MFS transporter, partial [Miltoncostaeaceae bacterium]|nr:MFS transporter [Miltoncostaeaceae bacterium]
SPTSPSPRAALAGLALAMLLSSLGTSVANVTLPTLERDLGASFGQVQWVVLAYLLAVTTLVVGAGRLGDLVGRRRLLAGGIATFALGSALCAAAPTLWALVAARAVQGLGAASMMALTLAFVADAVPAARTGSAMGLLGSTSAIGTALGPSLGGVLTAGPGWRAAFLLNVPLALVALRLVQRHLPADGAAPAGRRRIDLAGTLLLAVALGAYALAMTAGSGGTGALSAGLVLVALAAAALFARAERRSADPLVGAAMLRAPGLATGLATSALVSTVMMATLVVGPFHLARALGLGPALVGLVMSAGPAVVALAGVPAGRLADRAGAARVTRGGLLGMAAGAAGLAVVPVTAGVPGYVVPIVVLTLGYALVQTANNAAVMGGAPAERRGVTSGLLTLSRNLGLITGAALMGTIFARAAGTTQPGSAPPGDVAMGMRVTFAVAAALMLGALLVAGRAGRSAAVAPAALRG